MSNSIWQKYSFRLTKIILKIEFYQPDYYYSFCAFHVPKLLMAAVQMFDVDSEKDFLFSGNTDVGFLSFRDDFA